MAININIATPTLQKVTDSGRTTDNDIEFKDGAGVLLNNGSRLREGTLDSGAGGGIAQICAVGYELKWEAGSQYVMTGDGLQIREVNHKFNTIPDLNNDSTEGFYVGSRWILDNGDVYVCTDSTSAAAVWEKLPSIGDFVPYTGATNDLDMGTHNVTADHISLNVSPSGTGFNVGSTQWNNTIGSSETLLKGGNVTIKNGVDLVARIVNKVVPNTTLTKANYQAVRVSGAQGGRLAVNLAQANNDNNSADTIGIVTETIATNQEGFILTVGQLENINTTGSLQGETWVDGDVLYLSPTTAGTLTNIKPTGATGHIVVIGYVEYAHANNGSIYVKIMNGWELDELHNVAITSVANGQVLQYDSATSLWKNATPSGGAITVGTTAVTSGTIGRVFFQGTGDVIQQSSSLFWDNTNSRLGVGATPSASVRLDVRAQGALSTDIAFRVRNSANTRNIIEVRGNEIFYVEPTATFQANGINIQNNSLNRLEHSVSLIWSGTGTTIGYGCSSNQNMRTGSIGGSPIYGVINWHDQNIQIGSIGALDGRGVFSVGTNTAPTTNMLDGFRMYSADIVAGNAAPHFRTENGNIIKLYQQSSAGITTVAQLVTVMQNLGLLS